MAKVITFSQSFPFDKSRKTFFVHALIHALSGNERYVHSDEYMNLLMQLNSEALIDGRLSESDIKGFHEYEIKMPPYPSPLRKKNHTIRAGHRFKKGEYFSPRVWSGTPYNSSQIILWHDVKIEQTYEFEVRRIVTDKRRRDHLTVTIPYINNKKLKSWKEPDFDQQLFHQIAQNDGLRAEDFEQWFDIDMTPSSAPKPVFDGQIICAFDPKYPC